MPEFSAPLLEAAGASMATDHSPDDPLAGAEADPLPRPRPLITGRRIALGVVLVLVLLMGGAYSERHRFSAQGADLSRRLIGDENTARIESWYFVLQDRADKLKYRLFGGETNPFEAGEVVVQVVPRPEAPVYRINLARRADADVPLIRLPTLPPYMTPPEARPLDEGSLEEGEGVWTAAGLPRSSPTDPLMLKTFITPDPSRPYASVAVLLIDSRRTKLHIMGGTEDPGGDRGVIGPGAIPQSDLANLLAAWNGGFKGPHGGFGMVADGLEYRPLRNGLATICVDAAGVITMGEYGNDITRGETTVACRQNAVLLVHNGEVSTRVHEGNDTWGYVQVDSSEFITWRSAVGLTADGNLIVAAGNSLSAATLAKALWAAGAHTAMQLDINSPYVLTGLYFAQADGSLTAEKFMASMPDTATRFFRTQPRDFMYVTFDETRYRSLAR